MVSDETENTLGDSGGAMEAAEANHLAYEQSEPMRRPGRFTQFFFYSTGLGSAAFGLASMLVPDQVPMLEQITSRLAGFGIAPSACLFMGVALFAAGMLTSVFTHSVFLLGQRGDDQKEDSDFMLVADQLATDMAQSLSTLHQLSSELSELGENSRTMLRNMPDTKGQATANQTPMFRLAASVDQLCANVDSRLSNLGMELSASMQGINTSLSQVRGEMQENLEQASQAAREAQAAQAEAQARAAAAPAAPAAPVAPAAPAAPVAQAAPSAPMAPSPEVQASVEEVAAAMPHPMDAGPTEEPGSLELSEKSEDFASPALELFDQMEERPMDDSNPAAPFGASQDVDQLDDLMPKNHGSNEHDLGA